MVTAVNPYVTLRHKQPQAGLDLTFQKLRAIVVATNGLLFPLFSVQRWFGRWGDGSVTCYMVDLLEFLAFRSKFSALGKEVCLSCLKILFQLFCRTRDILCHTEGG